MTVTAEESVEFYDAAETTAAPSPRPTSAATLNRVVEELDEQLLGPEQVELPAERERTLRAPNFTKLAFSWSAEHDPLIRSINNSCAQRIRMDFADLFAIVEEIKAEAMRLGADPVTGEPGRPDYAAISESAKESWGLQLACELVVWEQRQAMYWGEAMMAKVIRQEVFTEAYLAVTGRSTVEDRTQAGQSASNTEYYFAVLCALLHKHAEKACRTAERLCQRLKDASAR